jgi:hypothetical protein
VVLGIVIGAVVALLLCAWIYDRKIRARNRRLRDSHEMSIADRDLCRSIRATRFGARPDLDTWKAPKS